MSYTRGTMLGPTPVSGWSLIMRAPISIIAKRSWFAGSCASNVDVRRDMSPCGRHDEQRRDDDRQERRQPEVLEDEQQPDRRRRRRPRRSA